MIYPANSNTSSNEAILNGQPAVDDNDLGMVTNGQKPVIVPVIEEQLQIDTQLIETGVVRIAKQVTEEIQTVDLPTIKEEVVVDRVAIYQYVDTPPAVRYEGDTTIFPVLREVLVTEKKLLLVEEVRVTRHRTTEQNVQEFTLRKEEITVERSVSDNERPA